MKKISQKQVVFYKLYKEWRRDSSRFVPAWEFVGEINILPLDRWFLMSYKCPTRLTDIFQENPNLLERQLIEGKSGAQYYGYKIKNPLTESMLIDPRLLRFYNEVKDTRNSDI